jgi:hypothetical protein
MEGAVAAPEYLPVKLVYMSRCFNFQVQRIQSRRAVEHVEVLLHALNAQAETNTKVKVDLRAADDCCNLLVESNEPKKMWERFAMFVSQNPQEFEWVKRRWIVVLEGKSGWNDYLLLAHFDASVRLDTVK